jgi:nitroimidazol reductase NimA-like FMN-containing flavoprotein (pyridoxamine 5'-phosphate oxidase superfamily)
MSDQNQSRPLVQPKASRPHLPGYGILDADSGKGLLPWSWAIERLTNARNYWVATTRPDGRPHVMPVWGVWMDDAFCFSTGAESRKARNLVANPRCVIGCELADDQIVVEGIVAPVADPALSKRFADAYGPKYNWDTEGFAEPVYVVRPTVVFGFITAPGEFIGSATRWVFDEK